MAQLSRHSYFLAHSNNVNCLRFGRKSGQVAATGGDDNVVNLWRMREKETKNIMSLSGHQSAIESLVFDPTERKIVAGSKSGSIKAFDLEAAKVSRTLKGHMSTCTTVDYHLYGDYVASGSLDTIVKVWDLRTKSCMQQFKGHKSDVTEVSFTPDGRWLTSGGVDGSIKIWDLTAGKLLKEFNDHGGAITCLEFNPEEFILVSSSTDKTVRFWDVQEFALIGATPTDNSTTTAMSHTVSEPYSGKYLFCCSQEAVRVWSYETAIECHDSVPCPRAKDAGASEVHADTTMLEDMKLMGGSIQREFVSIWILDITQVKPFDGVRQSRDAVKAALPKEQPNAQRVPGVQAAPVRTGGNISSTSDTQPEAVAPRPTTPATSSWSAPQQPSPVTTAIHRVGDPRRSSDGASDRQLKVNEPTVANSNNPEVDSHEALNAPGSVADAPARSAPEVVTADYIMELRCGMDTCVKTIKARHKCLQQLLVYWEKGNIHDALRYLGQLPNGKREALVVDVLRMTDLQSIGLDLEGCTLLLPLVLELLASKFEIYVSVGIDSGQKLFDAFSPVVKDARDARPLRLREVNLAGEERVQRCSTCDAHFRQMNQQVQQLVAHGTFPSLQAKATTLSQRLVEFSR
ncbi:TPA: hypothetical protein N0F65_012064 [Lagenidium giganteum]|uniref:Katanin p80 WD40 repeat-containing subunit B1 homolog n=1 Tax=Lagenidium giganteum TaxID=4803 RepID=A0AAV2YGY5_9STRA|nr:TPA: hypothetical protein N0F65_012064 [Lagenidium giganteum]